MSQFIYSHERRGRECEVAGRVGRRECGPERKITHARFVSQFIYSYEGRCGKWEGGSARSQAELVGGSAGLIGRCCDSVEPNFFRTLSSLPLKHLTNSGPRDTREKVCASLWYKFIHFYVIFINLLFDMTIFLLLLI